MKCVLMPTKDVCIIPEIKLYWRSKYFSNGETVLNEVICAVLHVMTLFYASCSFPPLRTHVVLCISVLGATPDHGSVCS